VRLRQRLAVPKVPLEEVKLEAQLREASWIREIVWIQDPDSDYGGYHRKRYDSEYPCGEDDEHGRPCLDESEHGYDRKHVCTPWVWIVEEPRKMTRWKATTHVEYDGEIRTVYGYGQTDAEAIENAITDFCAWMLSRQPQEAIS